MCVGGKRHAPAALLLGTHCKGGWMGSIAGLDGWRKPLLHRDSIPGTSSPQQVAVPTKNLCTFFNIISYTIYFIFLYYKF
jgi:hypothetical protein